MEEKKKVERGTTFLTREQIKARQSIGEPFEVVQWGGCVGIKKWSGKLRNQMIRRVTDVFGLDTDAIDVKAMKSEEISKTYDLMSEIVMLSLCDNNGVLVYDVENPEDLKEINDLDADILQLLFDECSARNGLLERSLKNEIKNSETTQK